MKGTPSIHPKTLVAMDMAGMDEIYVVGGAQAVAASTYGTTSIKPVDLIVGPGNSYVTEAKRQCFGQIGIDFLAGPSEVLVIADGSANPRIIAADLLAQSEHDKVAKGILVTTDLALGEAVLAQVENQLEDLSTRAIAEQSWKDYGEILFASDLDEAVQYANSFGNHGRRKTGVINNRETEKLRIVVYWTTDCGGLRRLCNRHESYIAHAGCRSVYRRALGWNVLKGLHPSEIECDRCGNYTAHRIIPCKRRRAGGPRTSSGSQTASG
jgi:hypothetical protein